MNIGNLKRNDTAAALAFMKSRVMAGDWMPEDGQMVFMLQDSPDELMSAWEKALDSDPELSAAFERLG